MKYEEWIKYEEQRERAATQRTLLCLPVKSKQSLPAKTRANSAPLKPSWTLIVQLFNSLLP